VFADLKYDDQSFDETAMAIVEMNFVRLRRTSDV